MSEQHSSRKHAIEAIKASADFIGITKDHFGISLKRAGAEWVGLCPFHDEKTPSFYINPSKSVYVCRGGCGEGAGGDLVNFVARMLGKSDGEALKWLSELTGIGIPRSSPRERQRPPAATGDTADLDRSVLKAACAFYFDQGKASVAFAEFCRLRGISVQSVCEYRLGFAPESSDLVAELTRTYGIIATEKDVKAALARTGLWKGGSANGSPFFSNRIIFPIFDRSGHVCGFGGRRLDESQSPKYLNSPDTPYFHKKSLLYGMNPPADASPEDRQRWLARARSATVNVVEGYTDVIALAQAGLLGFASMGTAFTPSHLACLRFTRADKVAFAFDGDDAGQKAAAKTLDALLPELTDGDHYSVLHLPLGLDPDDFFRSGRSLADWGDLDQVSFMTLWKKLALTRFPPDTIENRVRLKQHTLEAIQALSGKAPLTARVLEADMGEYFGQPAVPVLDDLHPWVGSLMALLVRKPAFFQSLLPAPRPVSSDACYPGLNLVLDALSRVEEGDRFESWAEFALALLERGVDGKAIALWTRAGEQFKPAELAEPVAETLNQVALFSGHHARLSPIWITSTPS